MITDQQKEKLASLYQAYMTQAYGSAYNGQLERAKFKASADEVISLNLDYTAAEKICVETINSWGS